MHHLTKPLAKSKTAGSEFIYIVARLKRLKQNYAISFYFLRYIY